MSGQTTENDVVIIKNLSKVRSERFCYLSFVLHILAHMPLRCTPLIWMAAQYNFLRLQFKALVLPYQRESVLVS